MITLRKRYVYDDEQIVKDVVLDKKDYGHSFADLFSECDIEGHVPSLYSGKIGKNEYIERCDRCKMERDCKSVKGGSRINDVGIKEYFPDRAIYGEWYNSICYECEENCIISRPVEKPQCPNCKKSDEGEDGGEFNGLFHSSGDSVLLYTCLACGKKDQVFD